MMSLLGIIYYPTSVQNGFHKPVGTFPSKRKVLNNDVYLDVYDKYYKFTTTTNQSGDFMLFGIPVGQQTIHFDLDLSDMGDLSLSPIDLISSGVDEGEFISIKPQNQPTTYKYKTNTNLDILPQIKSTNLDVSVQPFWGDTEQCQVGITRLDWNVEGVIIPSSIFIGSIFHGTTAYLSRCGSDPRVFGPVVDTPVGDIGLMATRNTNINIYRLDESDNPVFYKTENLDAKGNFAFLLPMNKGRLVKDGNGNLVLSNDESGIPSYGDYRIEISFVDKGNEVRLGGFFVPNTTGNEIPTDPFYMFSPMPTPDPSSSPATYLDPSLGILNQGFTNYFRFKAGRVFTLGQLILDRKQTNGKLQQLTGMWDTEANNPNRLPHPFNNITNYTNKQGILVDRNSFYSTWDNGYLANDNTNESSVPQYKWGSLYALPFRVTKKHRHGKVAVFGATAQGSGNGEEIGGFRSNPPYFYRFTPVENDNAMACVGTNYGFGMGNGATKILDLTKEHDATHNYFLTGFGGIDPQLPTTSNQDPGDINNQLFKGKYYYFGLHRGNTSLDLAKQKYNV